ncbi:unnamed protein product [Paramecium primaurelia]|uniref:Uncharacterized protein n=1 Tax=Paramecium primaurelia TaxID=5886 RepID=A0A8S1K4I2_PARPR|nr:unnamed protein product [Paramecium primaurelia]
MVFIKFLKNIDEEKKPLFCLFAKVIEHQTVMVFQNTLYVFDNQTIIDYFIEYRKQFKNVYSLQDTCKSCYQLHRKFDADIDVIIYNFLIEDQTADNKDIEITKMGGKKISLSVKKVSQLNQPQKSSVLIVQHPLCINFYLLLNNQFKQILEMKLKDIIISFSITNEQQLIILNEKNELEIYELSLGILHSQNILLKRIELNVYDQIFFKLTCNYLHGQRNVYKVRQDSLSEFLKYHDVKDSQPTDLEQLDDRMTDIRNMKVHQLRKDCWVFAYKRYEHFVYSQNSIYKILDQMVITTMALSKYYYQKINHVEQEEYLVQYEILVTAGIDQEKQEDTDKAYIKIFQLLQSSQLKCTMLIPLLQIVDLKYEIEYLEFIGQYDLIMKDTKGQIGIIQFTVEEFGQVLLQDQN